ncbi:4966_t:CDS:2 [Diversispora eburnea]|uniref:E3 ubiquitin-protein ligase n=1 Tax=Diversispora eburnea TaxID=1213867 RepID=A0A9N8V9M7_9GLOM|nr:4966_t:CDS:2 [Diversispora eburnea]
MESEGSFSTSKLTLSKYLQSCPKAFDYRFTEGAQQKILEYLFSEFWISNEEYRALFFPNGFGEGPDAYKLSLVQGDEYSSTQKGSACGHVFRKGEGVYRCRNCALDDTCVFCSRCFHATNHEGHDVSFSINTGSGGCCDCGDPEAWKKPINCCYHSSDSIQKSKDINQDEQIPLDLLNSIHNTICTVLDFMLNTLSVSPEEITPPPNEQEVKQEAEYVGRIINDTDDDIEEEKLFAIILWNDEHHSFQDVIDQVVEATSCTKEDARRLAERIDSYGRDIVELSEDIPRLLNIARTISSIGLAVTVRSARDTFREGMCGLFIDWLKDLVGGKIGKNCNLLRDIICEELCKEWKKRPAKSSKTNIRDSNRIWQDVFIDDEKYYQTENEEMIEDEVMAIIEQESDIQIEDDNSNDYNQSTEYNGDYDISMEVESNDIIEPMEEDESIYRGTMLMQTIEDFKKKLRLDKLLLLDLRLWKEARAGLRELYIGTLVVNREYKKIMGIRFARNYIKLAKAFLTPDREPEHSIVLFSVQLFTVPTISSILITEYSFLSTIFAILHTFFTSNTVGGVINPHAKIDCDSDSFKNRRYFHVFQDFRYIISNEHVKKVVQKYPCYLTQYLNLISLFQGMNPNVRATQQHVEYENDSWVNAFNVTLQIAKSCRLFSDCYAVNTETLSNTIRTVLRRLYEWCARRDEDEEETDKMDETSDEQQKESILSEWETSTPGSYGPFARSSKFSDDGNEDKDNNSPSLREPEFHDIIFPKNPYYLSFRVVKFEVSSQRVSFHHPLHWFLAELLEHVELLDDDMLFQHGLGNNFKNMIMRFCVKNEEELDAVVQKAREKILSVFDYPLRVLVLLVQIRAGLWVRNGFGIRGQGHHYREVSLRENTYDEDIFLIQTAFVILDPNLVLATILDRFDLVDWFNGISTHKIYDNTQLIFISEELLTLLIICVSERANAAGLSVEQEIRREIIHGLCLGSLPYSELSKRIPDRLTQDSRFDGILYQLSNYRSPDTPTDHGIYELKDEYFEEVDPYFVHYSRNNREEAEEALKNRLKKMDNSDKQIVPLIIPKLIPITKGPYVRLGNLLHARLLNQIIYYTLWHVKTDEKIKSDTLVEEALHLIMLALLDENNDIAQESKRKGKQKVVDGYELTTHNNDGIPGFMYYAVCDCFPDVGTGTNAMKTQGTNLLDLLLQLSNDANFKEFHTTIEFIINKFEQLGSVSAKLAIEKYREKIRVALQSKIGQENELSEYERKKQAAKERQRKIMEQFAIAQKSFIDKHEELYEEYDEMDQDWEITSGEDHLSDDKSKSPEVLWSYPTGTCIVCQEETNALSLYGMLGLIQPSKLLRRTPFEESDYVFEVINLPENLDKKYDRSFPYGVASSVYEAEESKGNNSNTPTRPLLSKGFPSNSCRAGLYASTCGHLMHVKCFDTYFTSLEQRHHMQLARNHPEDVKRKEFMCPLCKSLGNVIFPIIWKTKKETYPGILKTQEDFETWACDKIGPGLDKVNSNVHSNVHSISSSGSNNMSLTSNNEYRFSSPYNSGTFGAVRELASNNLPMNLAQVAINQPRRRNSSGAGRIRDALAQIVHMLRTPAAAQNTEEGVVPTVTLDDFPTLSVASSNTTTTTNRSGGELGTSDDDDQETIRKIYNRFYELIQMYSRAAPEITFQTVSIKSVEYMWDLFGYTISCIEISQRGFDNINNEGIKGKTLIDSINTQTLTLLRILSETILTYINTMLIGQLSGPVVDSSRKINGIFGPSFQFTKVKPLLLEDPFLLLVEISMFTATAAEYEIHHMMRLLFITEIVKSIISVIESIFNEKTKLWKDDKRIERKIEQAFFESKVSREFIIWLLKQVGHEERDIDKFLNEFEEKKFWKMIRSFCLPYLRKSIILLHSRYGVVFPITTTKTTEIPLSSNQESQESEESEFSRLSKLLGLPKLEEVCTTSSDSTLKSIISGWCNHLYTIRQEILPPHNQTNDVHEDQGFLVSSGINFRNKWNQIEVRVNQPTIFELVGLPKRLDALFEESLKKVCKKCKTVPHDPALCLLCGTFVCSQSYCCQENERGEWIYLLVKKCVILLLHLDNGCFMSAPYLDIHGEADLGLKRGRQQFLSQKRYDEIRKLWLTHGVPIHVARKIEQTFDLGGWPTM